MINLVNKDHIFNESMLDNIEFVDYENYREDTLYIEYNTFYHFEMLKAHLKVEDIYIDIKDAYRSLEKQESIFCEYMQKHGLEDAENNVSMPGFSEHHTGLAIDFVINVDNEWLEKIDQIEEQKEILNRIYKALKYFGFILRYPKEKENITMHEAKVNHITYVGEDIAKNIGNLTLEEYIYANNN